MSLDINNYKKTKAVALGSQWSTGDKKWFKWLGDFIQDIKSYVADNAGGSQIAEINLTSEDLNTLYSVGVELLPAPGVGKINIVHEVLIYYTFNTTAPNYGANPRTAYVSDACTTPINEADTSLRYLDRVHRGDPADITGNTFSIFRKDDPSFTVPLTTNINTKYMLFVGNSDSIPSTDCTAKIILIYDTITVF